MYACMYVCMYVCMYACMYVCLFVGDQLGCIDCRVNFQIRESWRVKMDLTKRSHGMKVICKLGHVTALGKTTRCRAGANSKLARFDLGVTCL